MKDKFDNTVMDVDPNKVEVTFPDMSKNPYGIPPNAAPYDHSIQIKFWQWPFVIAGLAMWFLFLAVMITGDEKYMTWMVDLME